MNQLLSGTGPGQVVATVAIVLLIVFGIGAGLHDHYRGQSKLKQHPVDLARFGATRGLVPFGLFGLRGMVSGSLHVVLRLEVLTQRHRGHGAKGDVLYTELCALPAAGPWTWPEGALVAFGPVIPSYMQALGLHALPTATDPELDARYGVVARFPVADDPRSAWEQRFHAAEDTVVAHHRRLAVLPVGEALRFLLLRRSMREVRVNRGGVVVRVDSRGVDARDFEDLVAVALAALEQVPLWERLIVEQQRAAGYPPRGRT